ncbi:hypothetical protein EYF80_041861 [Liparis tanakae]|uniref:Uncharacterized protein n=1 Tax=Liparis tanakae TaxID=230148 RepID=A0A4Z2G323_9TELE|nr:hypothetical protein EYF80_041861 [Liparis tanakae]
MNDVIKSNGIALDVISGFLFPQKHNNAGFIFSLRGRSFTSAASSSIGASRPHSTGRTRVGVAPPDGVPGLQEGEQPLLQDVEDGGEEEGERQQEEELVRELPPVVLGEELPPQLDGPRHGPELLAALVDRPRGGG